MSRIVREIKRIKEDLANGGLSRAKAGMVMRFQKKRMKRRRRAIADMIAGKLGYEVRHGIFKNMKLPMKSSWGCDHATKCLGIYELQTLNKIEEISKSEKITTLIDIGGADGYFAIGVLAGKLLDLAITFEITEAGRQTILDAAKMNNVHNLVRIYGEADQNSILRAMDENGIKQENCLFLVDIEGDEFDIFTPKFLRQFSQSEFIIELHDPVPGKRKSKEFCNAIRSHEKHIYTSTCRNPREFSELDILDDNDCWLLMSEGRGYPMEWLHLRPFHSRTGNR